MEYEVIKILFLVCSAVKTVFGIQKSSRHWQNTPVYKCP